MPVAENIQKLAFVKAEVDHSKEPSSISDPQSSASHMQADWTGTYSSKERADFDNRNTALNASILVSTPDSCRPTEGRASGKKQFDSAAFHTLGILVLWLTRLADIPREWWATGRKLFDSLAVHHAIL
jgi:hypothetical protein